MMCIFLSGIFSLCALCLYGLDKTSSALSCHVSEINKFGFCARLAKRL